jgi:superfamily II RNA helicase
MEKLPPFNALSWSVIFDEFHHISNPEVGVVWETSLCYRTKQI